MHNILITGASRGIGRAIALHLAAPDVHLFLHYDSQREAANDVAVAVHLQGAHCDIVQADLSSLSALDELAHGIVQRVDTLDGIVHNAGIYLGEGISDATPNGWQTVLDINLRAPYFLTQALLPLLSKGTHPAIVHIGSILGIRPAAGADAYQAAKSAIGHLTQSLALQLAPHIRVNAVAPGFIRTDLNQDGWQDEAFAARVEDDTPLNRWGEVEDIAPVVAFLLSQEARFITGQTLLVDGGKSLVR